MHLFLSVHLVYNVLCMIHSKVITCNSVNIFNPNIFGVTNMFSYRPSGAIKSSFNN